MINDLQYGVSTWLWESPFTNASVALFPKIKAMGFDLVEIPIEDPKLIDKVSIKQALQDHGLAASVCGAFGPTKDLTSEDNKLHQNCFQYMEQCFELAAYWGTNFVAGPMYSAVGKARMRSKEQRKVEWDRAVTNLRKVCAIGETNGQDIALEPLNRFESDLINTAEDVVQLVNDINLPNAKVALDSFHMTIEEKDLYAAIKTAGDLLIHFQVSENHRGIPGTGLTPWEAIRKGLIDINYQGAMVIESFTPEIKELAGAVCIWKKLAESQDTFASQGLGFLKNQFKK